MKNEKMGEPCHLGFTSTNHDPTRTPPHFRLCPFPTSIQKTAPRVRVWGGRSVSWSVGHSSRQRHLARVCVRDAHEHTTETAVSARERRANGARRRICMNSHVAVTRSFQSRVWR